MMTITLYKLAIVTLSTLFTLILAQDQKHLSVDPKDLSMSSDDFKKVFSRYGEYMRTISSIWENKQCLMNLCR